MIHNIAHVHTLASASRHHEHEGNTLLASWLRESATHMSNHVRMTDRALDSMALGNYDEPTTARQRFTHDWFAYEDEYAYNFGGLE